MISNIANGIVARGSEISSDFAKGRSDQAAAKVAFDVSLYFVTRKVPGARAKGGASATASEGASASLPGRAGVQIPGRLNGKQMAALSAEHKVEFALIYRTGAGRNGGGGSYWLYSGRERAVSVPLGADVRFISHTHPGGTAYASRPDFNVLAALR